MTKRPTDTELEILRVLWSRGPSTVREVHAALSLEKNLGYTSALKMLQVMHEKGYVVRDTSQRSHVYTPVESEEAVQGSLISDLINRAFSGSPTRLVMAALSEHQTEPEELARIRALLDELEDA